MRESKLVYLNTKRINEEGGYRVAEVRKAGRAVSGSC